MNEKSSPTRSLAIEGVLQTGNGDRFKMPRIPRIRISGKWLASADFNPGSRVILNIEGQGRITLCTV